jgi:hypothetical protein
MGTLLRRVAVKEVEFYVRSVNTEVSWWWFYLEEISDIYIGFLLNISSLRWSLSLL